MSGDLALHHTLELIGVGVMVDSSLYRLEPGVTLLVMMIVMNKGALVRLMFDHVERQGTFDTVFSHWCLLEGVRHRIYIVGGAIAFLSHTFLAVVLILSYVTKKDLVACSDGWFHCRQSTGVHVFFRKTRSCKKRCHEGGGGIPDCQRIAREVTSLAV